jgi:Domain of unknown function (DUF4157)
MRVPLTHQPSGPSGESVEPTIRAMEPTMRGHHFGSVLVHTPGPESSKAGFVGHESAGDAREQADRSAPIQAKLRVSRPPDPHEEEADRIAEQALSGTAPPEVRFLPHTPAPSSSWPVASDRVTAVEASLRGGEPFSNPVREFFESRFGFDLRSVRVHADERAAGGAQALRAHAFASGPHLVFGAGEYAPHTSAGRRLIAHELAHVAQQGAGGAPRVQRHNAADTRLPADQPEAFAFATAANREIQAALPRLAAAPELLHRNVPALVAQEGITLRPLTPRHDSAVGATDIQFFHGSTSYTGGVTLPEVATHHISASSTTISIRARNHADIDTMLLSFLIDERVAVAVLEAAERLATRPTSALTVFERYRARFNAIAEADGLSFVFDEFDPTLDSHGPRFFAARGIFDQIYASDPAFRSAYDANTGGIKERVDSYAGPNSLNPIASPGLQRLRAAFFPFSPPVTAVAGSARTQRIDVGPEATYTQAQAETSWIEDEAFFHNSPGLLDTMTANGGAQARFADAVRPPVGQAPLLTFHPLIVRHDSAAFVAQSNMVGGVPTPDPKKTAYFVLAPYGPHPDTAHSFVDDAGAAGFHLSGFPGIPGRLVVVNRTGDPSTHRLTASVSVPGARSLVRVIGDMTRRLKRSLLRSAYMPVLSLRLPVYWASVSTEPSSPSALAWVKLLAGAVSEKGSVPGGTTACSVGRAAGGAPDTSTRVERWARTLSRLLGEAALVETLRNRSSAPVPVSRTLKL